MNQLSADCGTYNQLRQQAHQYKRLVDTVDLIEQEPFSLFSPWKATPKRQCPVAEAPHILQHDIVETRFERSWQLYNLLQNKHSHIYVILKAEDGLSDLAFMRGWRIIHGGLYLHETIRYQAMAPILEYSIFTDIYLVDNVEPEDTTLFNDVIIPYYADNENHQPDADEEDFDEFFTPDETDTEEEF